MALMLASGLVCLVSLPGTASAGLFLEVPTIHAVPGSSGAFDVVLSYVGSGPDFQIGGFTLDLAVGGATGVHFDPQPTIATVQHPYLFAGIDSSVSLGLSSFSTDTFPTFQFTASDLAFNVPDFFKLVSAGDVYSLARVFYTVDAGVSPADVPLTIGPGTVLNDPTGAALPFVVPEPSSALLLGLGVFGLLARTFRRIAA